MVCASRYSLATHVALLLRLYGFPWSEQCVLTRVPLSLAFFTVLSLLGVVAVLLFDLSTSCLLVLLALLAILVASDLAPFG